MLNRDWCCRKNVISSELDEWLSKHTSDPVVYVNLGTVKIPDMKDVKAIVQALQEFTVVWAMQDMHMNQFNGTRSHHHWTEYRCAELHLLSSSVHLTVHC